VYSGTVVKLLTACLEECMGILKKKYLNVTRSGYGYCCVKESRLWKLCEWDVGGGQGWGR
jgi:hypothetical protein